MNVLNPSTAAQPTTGQSPSASHVNPASLIPKGAVFSVIGQVHDWQLGFAGRIRCSLRLSIGELKLRANRDTLCLDIGNGDWVRAKLMHRHEDSPAMHVLSAVAAAPAPGQTSWTPVSLYHRHAAMRELRRLLSTLEPALQGLFIALMLDPQVQRRFFWRPAAADHHCYPGGLFDQSIAAAVLAHRHADSDERGRGLVTMASLLFDIGKVSEMRLRVDRTRTWPALQSHPATALRLQRALTCIAQSQPVLAAELAELLADDSARVAALAHRMALLRTQVHRAVRASWGPAESFLTVRTTRTNPGAAA